MGGVDGCVGDGGGLLQRPLWLQLTSVVNGGGQLV